MGDSTYLLAFDFGGTKLVVALTDLDGTILAQSVVKSADYDDGISVLQAVLDEGQRLVHDVVANGRVQGIGMSTMGITRSDRVLMAPNIAGWEFLRIPEAVDRAFPGVPLRILNDMKAGALAELRRGSLVGSRSGLYVNVGTGVGVALTLGDQIIEGANGAAGEIAYNLLTSHESHGYADGVAPFEELAGGRFIGSRATARFHRYMTSEDIFRLADDDADAREFVEETVRELAFQLTNIVITWDPEKVVFGGGLVASAALILPTVKEYFQKFVPFPPVVQIARFENEAGLQGAIQLAIDASGQKSH